MSAQTEIALLEQLAGMYGVQLTYQDVNDRCQRASPETLLAVLKALGAPLMTAQDVPSAWRESQQKSWRRPLEPVNVVWEGELPDIRLRLPATLSEKTLRCHLKLESGISRQWEENGTDLPTLEMAEVEGERYTVKKLALLPRLPWGYHELTVETNGLEARSLLMVAPVKAYAPPAEEDRFWGVFLPLYALHTGHSWGSGDFSDLQALMDWAGGLGAGLVGTLPFLATFLDKIFEPSPYVPASRLFWNEFYLDITAAPEFRQCPAAQALVDSTGFQQEMAALRQSPRVDYARQMTLKRRALEEMCRCCFDLPDRLQALREFISARPEVEDYARFRAACEKQGIPWRSWNSTMRDGVLTEGNYDEAVKRYHLYVQWLAEQQVEAISQKARERGMRLYLDLPVGVHPDGYDVWREQDIFVSGVTVGAPPDAVFTSGQDWNFPPLHPGKVREQGYHHVIGYMRHQFRHAGVLRIDHMMGLHRLFWIPRGQEIREGAYISYHAEEFYAILTLESHRHRTTVVGEDLGIVPPQVRPAMARHGIQRMYVMYYELSNNPEVVNTPIPDSVVSLNTHDMPPFNAFWQGQDVEQRMALGFIRTEAAAEERETRRKMKAALVGLLRQKGWLTGPEEDTLSVLRACLAFLSASPARLALVNLEDLWLETRPQNVPGASGKYDSWQHKAKYSLEDFRNLPEVLMLLQEVDRVRKRGSL